MILADLAIGQSVFLDANVLVYHFAPDPVFGPHCIRCSTHQEWGIVWIHVDPCAHREEEHAAHGSSRGG